MEPDFNFLEFKLRYETEDKFKKLCDFLAAQKDEDDQPLIPNDDSETGIKTLLKLLKIQKPAEETAFTFTLNGKSIQDVEAECAERNLQFPNRVKQVCNRMYYNNNYAAGGAENWVEMSRPEASDSLQELSELFYLDSQSKIVDWSLSINALQTLGTNRKYTPAMMKSCLLKLVNKFHSDQTPLLRNKNENEIAQFLLKMDANRDKATYYKTKLHEQIRLPGEDFSTALTKAMTLIEKIYPKDEASNLPFHEACMKTAIISFIPNRISIPLLQEIRLASKKCEPFSMQTILEMATAADNAYRQPLTEQLQYGRQLENEQNAHVQFNSIEPTLELLMKKKRQAGTDPYNFLSYPTYHTMMSAQQYQDHTANPLMPNQQNQQQQQHLQPQQQQQAEAREQARQHLQQLREQAAASAVQNPATLHHQYIQNVQNQDEIQRQQRQQQKQRLQDQLTPTTLGTPLQHHQSSATNNPFTPDNLQDFDALSLTPFQRSPNYRIDPEKEKTPRTLFRNVHVPQSYPTATPTTSPEDSPPQQQPSPIQGAQALQNLDMSLQERTMGFHQSTPVDFSNPLGSVPIFEIPTNSKCIHNTQGTFIMLPTGLFKVTDGASENPPTPQQIHHFEAQSAARNLFTEETLNSAMNQGIASKLSAKKSKNTDPKTDVERMKTRASSKDDPNLNSMTNYPRSQSKSPPRSNQQSYNYQQRSSSRESRPRERQQPNFQQQQQQRGQINDGRYYRSNSGNFYRSTSQNYQQNNTYPQRNSSQNGYNRSNSFNRSNSTNRQQPYQYQNRSNSGQRQQHYQQTSNSYSRQPYNQQHRSNSQGRNTYRNNSSNFNNQRSNSQGRNQYGNSSNSRNNSAQRQQYNNSDQQQKQQYQPNRSYSQERQQYYSSQNRDNSHNEQSSSQNTYRNNRQQSRSPGRQTSYRNQGQQRNRSNSTNNRERAQSMERRKFYPEMKKGINCSFNYNPQKTKFCTKCSFGQDHHEFECQMYKKYEPKICTMCEKYHHEPDVCREIKNFPPSTSSTNNTELSKN